DTGEIKASFGKQGSGTLLKNSLLFENLNIPIDQFDLAYEGYKGSVKLFEGGSISAMNLSGGVPVSAMADAMAKLGSEITVLEISDEQLARMDRGAGLWSREIVPANTYPGQTSDINTSATPNILAVRADVPLEDVYAVTQTIFDNLDWLQKEHSATKQIRLDQATVSLPVPMHPGAEQYFKERGLRVPIASADFGDAFLSRYQTKQEARDTVNRGKVGIITGPTTHSSARAIDDIAAAVDRDGLRIIAMTGKGAGQNVTDLLYLKGVDAAVVGMDYLRYAKQYAYPDLDDRLKILTPLFDEEVHIVVKRGIYSLEQLAGKKVNFGEHGSGTELTAEILFRHVDIEVESTSHQDQIALELVKSGEIEAAVFVSAKPMPLLESIELADGLRFLSIPSIRYQDSYVESMITREDYPWLIDPKGIETIAVRTALVSYNWQPETARFEGVRLLAETLIDNLSDLSAIGRHPKLRDVDPMADFGGWPRLPAVDDYLARRGLAAEGAISQKYN
ncbi:MAG: TAXI family TRAP transporter solute-binding subunit, partial [Geminicoccaceae bacterium]